LFTGRENQLNDIGKLLKENYCVALSGLAGIGKTQLALEYAHCCYEAKVYQAVFWVSAADEASLQTGYATLAEKLDLPERDEQELHKIVRAVKKWLERHTNWLLIMDNADNLQLARSFFPKVYEDKENPGHILLTTRSQIIGNVAGEIIKLDKMESDEGLLFLLHRSDRKRIKDPLDAFATDTRNTASQIVALLDGHPLALDQAGAFIEDGSSFSEYINRYYEKRRELLDERGSLDEENEGKYSEYPDTIAVTFALCFEKASKRHPLSIDILRFCAFCHPDIIPDELLQHDESFKRDATEFKNGRTALLRYSLLKHNTQEHTFSIHRLVQAALIDAMPVDLQKQWRERVVRALSAVFPERVLSDMAGCARLMPHVLVCTPWIGDGLTSTVEASRLLNEAADYLLERGQYQDAEPLIRQALDMHERQGGVGAPGLARVLNNLAVLYFWQGKLEQMEPLLEQALYMSEHFSGAELSERAESLYMLSVLRRAQSKPELAESLAEQAIAVYEACLGSEHPSTARGWTSLAGLYGRQGRYKEAEALHLRAISVYEQQLGIDKSATAIFGWYHLAELYLKQCKYEEAGSLFEKALQVCEQELGAMHINTAGCQSGLARVYLGLGQYEKAKDLFERALAVEAKFPEAASYGEAAYFFHGFAKLLQHYGEYDQAELLYRRALTTLETREGLILLTKQEAQRDYATLLHLLDRDDEAVGLEATDEPPV